MKKNLLRFSTLLLLTMFFGLPGNAQVTVGDQKSPESFSLLELTTINRKGGLRLPHLTTDERDKLDLSSNLAEAKGLVIYNKDNHCVEYKNDDKWISLCSGSSSITITNPGGQNPFDPNKPVVNPTDPGSSVFPKDGGSKGPFTPSDFPPCKKNPPYQILAVSGGEYSKITVTDPVTGKFTLTLDANPTSRVRYAIVRVLNNCTGEYRDFLFSQNAQDVGVYPDPTQPVVPAGGDNRGTYVPEVNPETCLTPGSWTVISDQPWCIVTYNQTTGAFSLQFLPNTTIYSRVVSVIVKNNGCDKVAVYSITQKGNNIGLGPDNTKPNIPALGGETKPSTPEGDPTCALNPAYTLSLVTGNPYAHLVMLDTKTGSFQVKFEPNASIYERYATVRIKDNCSGSFRDFTYTQDGQNVGIYPDVTNPDVLAPGGQVGPYTPETNPANCPVPAPYAVTSDQTWCKPVVTNTTTGTFYLVFEPNHLSTPRYVNITVAATGCSKSTTYHVKQLGANVDLGIGNYPAPDVLATGGDTPKGVPSSEVRCNQNPAYIPTLIAGNAYATLVLENTALGIFHVTFSPNPLTSSRTATVRVTNPCNGLYSDFTYTQLGSDCTLKVIATSGLLSQSVEQNQPINQVELSSPSAISVTGTVPGVNIVGRGSNRVIILGNPTTPGDYQLVASTGNTGCANESKTILLTVTAANACATKPGIPRDESGAGASRCGSGEVTLKVSGLKTGEYYRWYDESGSLVSEGTSDTYKPTVSSTTKFYVSKYNGNGCETEVADWLTITATVNQVPSAGLILGANSIEVGSKIRLSNQTAGGEWSSSDMSVAKINSSTGELTGLSAGSVTITYTVTNQNHCSDNTTYEVTVIENPALLPIGSGTLTGRTCFDVAKINASTDCGALTARQAKGVQADFTQTSVNTQPYTFTPSGTVSKVRFAWIETIGSGQIVQSLTPSKDYSSLTGISGACTATLVYKTTLNSDAAGKTNANALTVDIYVIYNDNAFGTGVDKAVKLTASIKDCACCGAKTTDGSWLNFMCHNLGAENSGLDPFSYNSGKINGDYYQWGRPKDGHQVYYGKNKLNTTTTAATSTTPGHDKFIIDEKGNSNPYPNYDWRGIAGKEETARWGDGTDNANMPKAANDPCPAGWKVPSQKQWASIASSKTTPNKWTWVEASMTFDGESVTTGGYKVGDLLYLPAAGYRSHTDGKINYMYSGYYWSSTVDQTICNALPFVASVPCSACSSSILIRDVAALNTQNFRNRGDGLSVRCVQE